ncbi:MAG: ATP synthase F1 subunit gamma [Candidatus Omnitrophota bacterium]|jgi:F-type H+-transporting ATPase subunit gamma
MLQNLRQIKNRIRSIDSTRKVTSAMEMISVTKLTRVNKILSGFRSYFQKSERIVNELISSEGRITHPLLEKKDVASICLCLITSDGGLCGLYNNNIIRFAEDFISQKGIDKVKLVVAGRKGFNYFKHKQVEILNSYIGLNGRYSETAVDRITALLVDTFLQNQAGEVYVAYTHLEKIIIHKPTLVKLLHIDTPAGRGRRYLLEPGINTLLDSLIPKYIYSKMRLIFLESFASEHASRAVAMKTATDNAQELSQSLVLLRNKVRQANITQDIMEIISSAEALKG